LELGIAVGVRGDLTRSWALHQEALAGWRARGNRYRSSNVLVHLGIIAQERGDPAAATGHLSEAVGLCEAGNQVWLGGVALASLGNVVLDGGAVAEAAAWFRRSLALHAQHGDGAVAVFGLLGMARIAAARQRPEAAARLLSAARAAHERYGTLLYPGVRAHLAETETTLRERLGAEAFAAAWAAGQGMAITDAIAEAEAMAEAASAPAPPHRADRFGLSARELDVLRLVVAGRANSAIATELFISRRTVTTHITNIFAKLGVANRAEAVAFAHRHGLG
jgi:DNA-binding NarL/FixJ family response regulator